MGPVRKPAARAGATIRHSCPIRPTTPLSGSSTSTCPRQVPLDGVCESALLIWLEEEQRPRQVQLVHPLQRQLRHLVPAVGGQVQTCQVSGLALLAYFSRATGSFTPWAGVARIRQATSLPIRSSTDPATNSWTTKSATYPDIQVNNIACGVLNDSGTDFIYCVGGSDVASQTGTGRVFRYDPVADVITTLTGAEWPPGNSFILPGGFTVARTISSTFWAGSTFPTGSGSLTSGSLTPGTNAWVQKVSLPVPLGYIPTATIGSVIYTGGGADITGGVLTDTTNSFVFDPVANTIGTIADIPRPTSNTRGLNLCGQMYVLGGCIQYRSPTKWTSTIRLAIRGQLASLSPSPGATAASDTDGTNNIWLAGGYDSHCRSDCFTGNLQLPGESLRGAYVRRRQLRRTPTPPPSPTAIGNGYNHTTTCVAYTIGDPATADTAAAPNTVPSSLAESALLL